MMRLGIVERQALVYNSNVKNAGKELCYKQQKSISKLDLYICVHMCTRVYMCVHVCP
jgi:hypothetical protein